MILCCGEALIDMLPRSLENGENSYLPRAGGAVFNTAVALGRLGEDTAFFSGISTDMFGQQLAAALAEAGVDYSRSIRSARPTTLAFVELSGGNANYTFYDENSAGRMISPDNLPDLPPSDVAHFGAISLIGEPCGTAYEALAMQLKKRTFISLDPNVRSRFIRDENSYRARLGRMTAIADIIKVSDEDFAWLMPGHGFEACARNWLDGGAKIVVQTRGPSGIVALTNNARIEIPAFATSVVDTVGAGDSFNAGLLCGLRRSGLLVGEELAEAPVDAVRPALELAMRVAAITVSRRGADPPWAEEIATATQDLPG